jgi:hypothetical protein
VWRVKKFFIFFVFRQLTSEPKFKALDSKAILFGGPQAHAGHAMRVNAPLFPTVKIRD